MASELRQTGISIVGEIPWGAHFCSFYETKQDLLDILIPYFKTGLKNNEFCLWVISNSELLTVREATSALRTVLPDLDRYVTERSIEIVGHNDWFLEGKTFDPDQVANRFKKKLDEALARGLAGMRVNGSPAWLRDAGQQDLRKFEAKLDRLFPKERLIASCTYPLTSIQGDEIFDVVDTHQFAIARRQGKWEVVETPELIQAKAEIKLLNEELEQRVIERTRELAATNAELRREIAERKHAEALLHAREQEFRAIVENAPDQIIRYDRQFRRTYVNPAVAQFYGLPVETLIGKPLGSGIPEAGLDLKKDELAQVRQRIADVFNTGKSYEYEMTWTMPEGRSYFSIRFFPEFDLNGSVVNVLGISRDITERKLAEDAVRRSEDRIRLIIDTIPTMAWTVRPDGTVDFLNQRWLDYSGLSLEQYVEDPTGLIHPEDIPRVLEKWRASMAVEEAFEDEMRLRRDDGEYRWFLIRTAPLRDEQGNLVKWYGVSIDIEERKRAETERRSAEEELKKEKETLEKIFDSVPVLMGFVGEDGRVKMVNPEWERTMGWTLKELQEQNVDIFAEAYPDLSYRQKVLDFVAAATGEWVDLKIRVRDGRLIDAACAVVLLSDGTKVAIAQDITERKQAEEKIKATSEQLRALSANLESAREDEAARIARELHDELGSTLSCLKWDLEEVLEGSAASANLTQITELRKRIEAMIELTDTTLNAVRRIVSELRPIALDELGLSAAIEWQAQQFQTRTGIICRCECSLENVALGREQATAVFRIFQEALTNILRHAEATTVEITLKQDDGELVLTIGDNGRGITEQEKSGSHSLGLLGMRERCHLIGGKIDISGTDGEGTVVTVCVPIGLKE